MQFTYSLKFLFEKFYIILIIRKIPYYFPSLHRCTLISSRIRTYLQFNYLRINKDCPSLLIKKKKKRSTDKSTTILKTVIKYDSHRDRVRDTSNPQQLSPRMRIKRQRILTVVNPGRIIAGQRSLLRGRHVSPFALVVETTTTLKRWRPVVRGERWFYISIRLRWGHDHFFLFLLFISFFLSRYDEWKSKGNLVAGWKGWIEKLDCSDCHDIKF